MKRSWLLLSVMGTFFITLTSLANKASALTQPVKKIKQDVKIVCTLTYDKTTYEKNTLVGQERVKDKKLYEIERTSCLSNTQDGSVEQNISKWSYYDEKTGQETPGTLPFSRGSITRYTKGNILRESYSEERFKTLEDLKKEAGQTKITNSTYEIIPENPPENPNVVERLTQREEDRREMNPIGEKRTSTFKAGATEWIITITRDQYTESGRGNKTAIISNYKQTCSVEKVTVPFSWLTHVNFSCL